MKKGVLLVAALVVGAIALVAVFANPRTPNAAQPPSEHGGEGFDPAMPTIEVDWTRVGGDVVVTVTRADPEKPLDCRWTAWVWDVTDEGYPFIGINLTNGVAPSGEPPGAGMCTAADPRFVFADGDADRMLSVGDRWVLHGVPGGTEFNLELVLSYWGMQQTWFRWGNGGTLGR